MLVFCASGKEFTIWAEAHTANVEIACFAGRFIDESFLASLPAEVDPCGENGEFHSFVFDGPIFAEAVKFSLGEAVLRNGFWFRDLLPE